MFCLLIIALVASIELLVSKDELSCNDNDERLLTLVEIDVKDYLNANDIGKKTIANVVDEQLQQIGMFRIKNHGLSADLINELLSDSKHFFDQSEVYKSSYKANDLFGANGWQPVGKVNAAKFYNLSARPDPVEFFALWFAQLFNVSDPENNLYDYCPAELCKKIMTYLEKTSNIVHILQSLFTLSLNLSINQFKVDMTDMTDSSIDNHYFTVFRIWNYLHLNDNRFINDDLSDQYRMAPHSDFMEISVLRPDDISGLQVKLERIDNEWYTINDDDIAEDSLIIIVGEVMEMYTSGYWIAAKHRVARLSKERRISVANFFGPNMNRIISELSGCIKCKQNGNHTVMQKYELPMTYKKHIRMRYSGIFSYE